MIEMSQVYLFVGFFCAALMSVGALGVWTVLRMIREDADRLDPDKIKRQ